jgi:ABC-2 type transport system permease protein
MNRKKNIISILIVICAIIILNVISQYFFHRFDLTSEKRYSISDNSKKLLKNLDRNLSVIVYLDGDLNSGFLRLRKSTVEMLDEFKAYAGRKINYTFVNPSAAATEQQRAEKYRDLEAIGLKPIQVFDKDAEGKSTQKIIFPWAQFVKGNDTLNVNLLKNIQGKSGSENLNISIENLEFELTDAIRRLTKTSIDKIAFIEGHNDLHEILTQDITEAFSNYFQVDRGAISNDPRILDDYKAIIIAKPHNKFSEPEKYVIDQYIMNGGRTMWLVDGARVSIDTLATYGMSPAIPNDVNLNDQLFKYGVRINPDLLIDANCAYIYLDVSAEGEQPNYQLSPWYFAPLLVPSNTHAISKNLVEVKSEFVSSIDFVGNNPDVKHTVLLTTSQYSRSIQLPTRIGFEITEMPRNPVFFPQQYLTTGVLMEGKFPSVFANRFPPQGVLPTIEQKSQSEPTKMIVVANGDVILNDVRGVGANAEVQPLGFDANMNVQFGNKDFIMNSMLYLTDDEGWLELRAREFKLRLLDKVTVAQNKTKLQIINVLLPIILLIIYAIVNFFVRQRKYTK